MFNHFFVRLFLLDNTSLEPQISGFQVSLLNQERIIEIIKNTIEEKLRSSNTTRIFQTQVINCIFSTLIFISSLLFAYLYNVYLYYCMCIVNINIMCFWVITYPLYHISSWWLLIAYMGTIVPKRFLGNMTCHHGIWFGDSQWSSFLFLYNYLSYTWSVAWLCAYVVEF
jgi:hypothetical protein